MFFEKLGIKGKVTVKMRKSDPYIALLEKQWLKEIETGVRLLRDEEYEALDRTVVKECTVDNVFVEIGLDRMIDLFSRGVGYQMNLWGDDRAGIAQNSSCEMDLLTINNDTNAIQEEALYPEVIGLGTGTTTPTITDTSLATEIASSYRNTYNLKEGGHNRKNPSGSYDYDTNYICKYAYIYTTDELNTPANIRISEAGLFLPVIRVGPYRVGEDLTIVFDGDLPNPTPNHYWTILNISLAWDDGANYWLAQLRRSRWSATRTGSSQTIDLGEDTTYINYTTGPPVLPPRAIVSYTPRYDTVAANPAVGGTMGDSYNFNAGSPDAVTFEHGDLVARTVLPVDFIKNVNYSLTVLWQIYLYKE